METPKTQAPAEPAIDKQKLEEEKKRREKAVKEQQIVRKDAPDTI